MNRNTSSTIVHTMTATWLHHQFERTVNNCAFDDIDGDS